MADKKKSTFQEISELVKKKIKDFLNFLKPNPSDHWLIQLVKSIGKAFVVLLLILFSPILFLVLLIVFLIAI